MVHAAIFTHAHNETAPNNRALEMNFYTEVRKLL